MCIEILTLLRGKIWLFKGRKNHSGRRPWPVDGREGAIEVQGGCRVGADQVQNGYRAGVKRGGKGAKKAIDLRSRGGVNQSRNQGRVYCGCFSDRPCRSYCGLHRCGYQRIWGGQNGESDRDHRGRSGAALWYPWRSGPLSLDESATRAGGQFIRDCKNAVTRHVTAQNHARPLY